MCVGVYVYVCVYAYVCVYIYIYIYVYMYICMYMYIYIYIYRCIYAYIHMYLYLYLYVCLPSRPSCRVPFLGYWSPPCYYNPIQYRRLATISYHMLLCLLCYIPPGNARRGRKLDKCRKGKTWKDGQMEQCPSYHSPE